MKVQVCFVCSGNSIRSPYAESVLRQLLAENDMDQIEVYSLGTIEWGSNPRDEKMVQIANEMGYKLDGTTVCMTPLLLYIADIIIVFDESHRQAVTRELAYAHWDRIVSFNSFAFGVEGNVEDPNYQSDAVYRRVAEHIEKGCKEIVARWKQEPPKSRS